MISECRHKCPQACYVETYAATLSHASLSDESIKNFLKDDVQYLEEHFLHTMRIREVSQVRLCETQSGAVITRSISFNLNTKDTQKFDR